MGAPAARPAMGRIRTFVAVDLEHPEVAARIAEVQRGIQETDNGVKLVEPENLHVTLKFLGGVDEAAIPEVVRLLSGPEVGPFRARLFGVGAFPSVSRPRVIWVGFEEGREELIGLMRWVDSRLRRLGFPREEREPHPHLTIARVKWLRDREALRRVLSSLTSTEFGEIEVREIRVKKSTLTPRGPIYETLASIPLPAGGG